MKNTILVYNYCNADKDLSRKNLKSKAIWRGQHKTSEFFILIVIPRKIEIKRERERERESKYVYIYIYIYKIYIKIIKNRIFNILISCRLEAALFQKLSSDACNYWQTLATIERQL